MVLMCQIEKVKSDQLHLYKGLLDSLKVYINPKLFQREMDMRPDGSGPRMVKRNSEFEQHSVSAAISGKPTLSPDMAAALASYKERRAALTEQNYIPIKLDEPGVTSAPQSVSEEPKPLQSSDDDEVLG